MRNLLPLVIAKSRSVSHCQKLQFPSCVRGGLTIDSFGQSVLIAARTDEAMDVNQRLLGDVSFVLRGGRRGQFAELKAYQIPLPTGAAAFPAGMSHLSLLPHRRGKTNLDDQGSFACIAGNE
jgi:hypothetical protein